MLNKKIFSYFKNIKNIKKTKFHNTMHPINVFYTKFRHIECYLILNKNLNITIIIYFYLFHIIYLKKKIIKLFIYIYLNLSFIF